MPYPFEVIQGDGDILFVYENATSNRNDGTVTERYTPMDDNHLWYEATIEDASTFARPWTIEMPLYRRLERNPAIFEYKCVEIAEPLLYGVLLKDPIE